MKRWGKVLLSVVMMLGLAGCAKDGTVKESRVQEVAIPTAEELIAKITEASEGLSSFVQESQSWLNTDMAQGENQVNSTSETQSTSEYALNPLQMHQVSRLNVSGQDEQDMEIYLVEAGYFTLFNGYWRKMPETMLEAIKVPFQLAASPKERMKQFKTILPYLMVTEEGDDYVLTARASGEQMKDLKAYYEVQYSGVESPEQLIAAVKSMSTMYSVDKQTYWPTWTEDEMVTDDRKDGQGMYTVMKMKSTIGKYNTLSKIEVPEEALSAQR